MTSPMRVLIFLDTLNRGGTETLQLDVCRKAKSHGLDLIMATSLGGDLESEFNESGPKFIKLGRRAPMDFGLIKDLRRIIQEHEIQIVHGHQAVEGLHLDLACLGLRNVKRVLSFHGFIQDVKNKWALKFLIPRTDANLVVSRGLQDALHADNGLDTKNFTVLYNGVDPDRLRSTGRSFRAELGISESALLLGMIANFYKDPRKDQLTVVRALKGVFPRVQNAHFVFAGKVEEGAEAYFDECRRVCSEAGISDRVHFVGPRRDIPDILESLDLHVLSSLHEGLPISLIESMLTRVPALVSDIPQFREISDDGRCIKTFPVGEVSDLEVQLTQLINEPELRRSLGDAGYLHAVEKFSITAHLTNLKELYERITTS